MKPQMRTNKLIQPVLQLKLAMGFLLGAILAVVVSWVLLYYTLNQVAADLPNDGIHILNALPRILGINLLFSVLIMTPVLLAVGVFSTFKIVGPIHRFQQFLRGVADGTETAPCQIRKTDHLADFCELLNEVTEPLREQNTQIQHPLDESSETPAPVTAPADLQN